MTGELLASEARPGPGPRLLFLHSIGLDRTSWYEVVDRLPPDVDVLLVDLPGHGESLGTVPDHCGVMLQAELVRDVMRRHGWDDAVFIGNSLGGGVSLAAALRFPELVAGLVLANTVAYPDGLPWVGRLGTIPGVHVPVRLASRPFVPLALKLARRQWGSVTRERVQRASGYFAHTGGADAFFRVLRALYGPDLHELGPRYGEVQCPALVLHGANDPLISLQHARRLGEALPAGRLETIARCGHFPQEELPQEVADRIMAFLSASDLAR